MVNVNSRELHEDAGGGRELKRVRQFPTFSIKNRALWNFVFSTRLHDICASIEMKLARLDYDILHLLNVPAWVYVSINSLKRDKLIVAHIWYYNKLISFFWRQEIRLLGRFCDKVIVTSDYLARWYEHFLGQKVAKVPPPINTGKFKPRNTLDAWRHLGLPPNETLVGYIGELHPQRGIFELCEAFKYVKNSKLVIASHYANASDIYMLKMYLRKLKDKVLVLDTLSYPELFYNTVDVLVLPFRNGHAVTEPPLTVLEALSSGTPLITTSSRGSVEFIKHEYNAILTAPCPEDMPMRSID